MNTFPIVPEELERELTIGTFDRVIRFKDGGVERSVEVIPEDPYARVRIVLRPFLEVEASDAEGPGTLTEIPLWMVMGVDVDRREYRHGPPCEGEDDLTYDDVSVPVSRWVRHPDKGLVRFSAR